jgi:hypothetical protein
VGDYALDSRELYTCEYIQGELEVVKPSWVDVMLWRGGEVEPKCPGVTVETEGLLEPLLLKPECFA